MARPIILSNGRLLVGLNERGLVQDFYFPYVGQSNMTNARQVEHKIGISVDGNFSWLSDESWDVDYFYEDDALIGHTVYDNKSLGLKIDGVSFTDIYDDVFCRKFTVSSTNGKSKKVRLFLHQVLRISANGRADSCLYVPAKHPYILTYRGNTALATSLSTEDGAPFSQYAVGVYDQDNSSGTYHDAEDSELSMNPVEHGSVDSTIGLDLDLNDNAPKTVYYWVAASTKNYHASTSKHREIVKSGVDAMLDRTRSYWQKWLSASDVKLAKLSEDEKKKIRLALLVIKSHTDERGGVLASSDSSIFNYGKDYYSYVWPRDAAYALMPLVRLGYTSEAMQYFRFVERTMHPKGYMHQKYQPDGGLGSTWHPMLQNGKPELNIQEDETASTVLLFFELAKVCDDKDFIADLYENIIVRMLNFMAGYLNQHTGLPYPSYDLWEEKFLTTTYSTLLVARALELGAEYGGKSADSNHPIWETAARIIRANITKLFSSDNQYFAKGITPEMHGEYHTDSVIDISTLYSLFKYGHYGKDHMAIISTEKAVIDRIADKSPSGGVTRYENDKYMLSKQFTGNPWHVCTLWLAQYYIWAGKNDEAKKFIDWTLSHSLKNGIMSEQIDPETGSEIGVAPLVWSHAELINTLLDMNSVSD